MSVEARSAEDQAHLIIYDRWVMMAGQAAYFVIVAILYFFFRPVVPHLQMTIWLAIAGSIIFYIIIFDVTLYLRDPDQDELLRFWRAIDKKHTILFDMIAVGVIALLLPFGEERHRIVTVSFCVGYVPLQMISDPENVFGNRFSIVAVLGAFVIFLLLQGETYSFILAAFMAIYGTTLFYSSGVFRTVVVDALRNRRAAEKAMIEVAAERDAKTRFIAAASHDLGQPLHAARLFSEQLADATVSAARERAQTGLERSISSAQAMLGNMLYHMQLEADAVTPHTQSVDVRHVVEGLARQYAAMAVDAGIAIETVGRSTVIMTDPVLLERAVGNLIQNSMTHSDGSRLLLGCRLLGGWQQIWVIDNGRGISPEDEPRIFQDYVQGRESRAQIRGGFGLGLASVRRIAQLLGGDVRLDRRWAKGAAFCLSLPVAGPST